MCAVRYFSTGWAGPRRCGALGRPNADPMAVSAARAWLTGRCPRHPYSGLATRARCGGCEPPPGATSSERVSGTPVETRGRSVRSRRPVVSPSRRCTGGSGGSAGGQRCPSRSPRRPARDRCWRRLRQLAWAISAASADAAASCVDDGEGLGAEVHRSLPGGMQYLGVCGWRFGWRLVAIRMPHRGSP